MGGRPHDPYGETFVLSEYRSPLGPYLLASSQWGVVGVKSDRRSQLYVERWEKEGISVRHDPNANAELVSQLDAYFGGTLRRFTVPLDLRGTPFQRRVWDVLNTIPWGETMSYGQVAAALGRPEAARAVGRAVGTNPVAIVVPCHRVLGSDGSLTGYGGGLEKKTALLRLEGIGYSG
jgi:methylated-DNA-[protein]-cysteine S-methyltransferase